jgi:hypothetical protein
MAQAQRLACVVVTPSDHDTVDATLKGLVERIELVDRGSFLVDIVPFTDDEHAQTVLRGLSKGAQVGIANGRFTAEQAARTSAVVPVGKERAFLAGLDVRRLPVGAEMERRLLLLGLKTLGDLAELPKAAVVHQFGRDALLLYDMARGRDPRPLRPDAPPLQIDRVARFLDATTHRGFIREQVQCVSSELADTLVQQGYQAEVVRLSVHLEDLQVLSYKHVLKPPTADPARLCRIAGQLLEVNRLDVPVTQVVVTAFPMRSWHLGATQMSLFQSREEVRQRELDEVIRQIRRRFGAQAIVTAAEIGEPRPKAARVTADQRGFPLSVRLTSGVRRVVELIEHWHEERGWAENERHRDYFQVVLDGAGAVRTLFRNMVDGRWYLERFNRLL